MLPTPTPGGSGPNTPRSSRAGRLSRRSPHEEQARPHPYAPAHSREASPGSNSGGSSTSAGGTSSGNTPSKQSTEVPSLPGSSFSSPDRSMLRLRFEAMGESPRSVRSDSSRGSMHSEVFDTWDPFATQMTKQEATVMSNLREEVFAMRDKLEHQREPLQRSSILIETREVLIKAIATEIERLQPQRAGNPAVTRLVDLNAQLEAQRRELQQVNVRWAAEGGRKWETLASLLKPLETQILAEECNRGLDEMKEFLMVERAWLDGQVTVLQESRRKIARTEREKTELRRRLLELTKRPCEWRTFKIHLRMLEKQIEDLEGIKRKAVKMIERWERDDRQWKRCQERYEADMKHLE